MANTLFEYVAETLAFWEDYLVKVDAEFAESHGLVEGKSSPGVHSSGLLRCLECSSGLHSRHLGCILLKTAAAFVALAGEYVVLNDCFQELCGVPDGYGGYPWNVENINNQLTVAYLRYHLSALLEMAAAGYGSAA